MKDRHTCILLNTMKTNHLQYGTRMHIALLSIESAVRFVDVVIVAVR